MTNRKSITGFPTSYRWSAYITCASLKGWLKSDFCFLIKLNFTNKVWYKVSLCENFQRQRYSKLWRKKLSSQLKVIARNKFILTRVRLLCDLCPCRFQRSVAFSRYFPTHWCVFRECQELSSPPFLTKSSATAEIARDAGVSPQLKSVI